MNRFDAYPSPGRPDLSTVLAALKLREPDPVRTAAAAETLGRLLAWLAFDGRTRRSFSLSQQRGGDWYVRLDEDFIEAGWSSRPDPIDALNHALTVADRDMRDHETALEGAE